MVDFCLSLGCRFKALSRGAMALSRGLSRDVLGAMSRVMARGLSGDPEVGSNSPESRLVGEMSLKYITWISLRDVTKTYNMDKFRVKHIRVKV